MTNTTTITVRNVCRIVKFKVSRATNIAVIGAVTAIKMRNIKAIELGRLCLMTTLVESFMETG